jgi:hypothetical protein
MKFKIQIIGNKNIEADTPEVAMEIAKTGLPEGFAIKSITFMKRIEK